MKPMPRFPSANVQRQRGVVLIFALIALAVLLIGAVVMVRSMNVTLVNAGNAGFKRDLTNQSDRAVATVFTTFNTGVLAAASSRHNPVSAANYSASLLASNPQGIPLALLDDTQFAAVGSALNDITVPDLNVTVRYVVDRMCVAGFVGAANTSNCTMSGNLVTGGSGSETPSVGTLPPRPVYRVSVRVTGPRATESYFQSTFAM